MARTAEMRLIELMVLKEDIASVLEFIGKRGTFQFLGNSHNEKDSVTSEADDMQVLMDTDRQYYEELLKASVFFGIETGSIDVSSYSVPTTEDRTKVNKFIASNRQLEEKIEEAHQKLEKVTDAYKEAKAFLILRFLIQSWNIFLFCLLRLERLRLKIMRC